MPRDQIDFQSCDILKSSLDIFLFTQTQVNRLCTKLPGWSPKAYHVQEVKPEELTVSSKHQSFMNLLLKFCFQCLIPFPATATGQAAPGHGRGGQEHRAPFALAMTGIFLKSSVQPWDRITEKQGGCGAVLHRTLLSYPRRCSRSRIFKCGLMQFPPSLTERVDSCSRTSPPPSTVFRHTGLIYDV